MCVSRILALLCSLALVSCGGSGGGSSATVPDGNTGGTDTGAGSVALSAAETQASLQAEGAAGAASPFETVNFGVKLLDSDRVAKVTVNNTESFLTFDGYNRFASADGTKSLSFSRGPVDGKFAGDAVAMLYIDGQRVYSHLFGNETSAANLPVTGTARYTGQGAVWTGLIGQTAPRIDLDMNFANSTISGRVQQAIYSAPVVDLTMAATQVVNGSFTGSLTSDLMTIRDGSLTGTFYGKDGSTLGGTLNVATMMGVSTGYYLAKQQTE